MSLTAATSGVRNRKRGTETTNTNTNTHTHTSAGATSANANANSNMRNDDMESFSFDNMPHSSDHPPNDDTRLARRTASVSAQALSMTFMKTISGVCCQECGNDPILLPATSTVAGTGAGTTEEEKEKQDATGAGAGTGRTTPSDGNTPSNGPSGLYNLQAFERTSSSISALVTAPMLNISRNLNNGASTSTSPGTNSNTNSTTMDTTTIEGLIGEYMCLCQFYKVPYNAGIVTTLRFSLPSLRVSGSFHDLDMLALVELLLRHANDRLRFIHRLDFTIASKEGRQFLSSKQMGFTSHGALALAKLLQTTQHLQQVWLSRHRIGPYGASAIFLACRDNPTILNLDLRRCRIGERGAFAFCELISRSRTGSGTATGIARRKESHGTATSSSGLMDVDLSSNGIGHRGTVAIERVMEKINLDSSNPPLFVNLEGNLVFPEIMNGITHGLGVILCLIGGYLLSERVKEKSLTHSISCAIYTTSLLALYLSSTLFHSFFSLQNVKYIFQVMDKCAIYVLIAGSYTPFLTVMFADKPLYSVVLLGFIWTCGFLGISVEAFAPTWKYRPMFSLAMYLGMGWACLVVLPETKERLPLPGIHLLMLGGVGYTAGVPFFVRNNNLDHAIWHLFVLLGSICHWVAVYVYVAPFDLP